MMKKGGWARAAAWSAAAAVLGIVVAASGIHRAEQLGVDFLYSGLVLGASVGLLFGAAAGWNLGPRGMLYPLLILPGLRAAQLVLGGLFWDAVWAVIVYSMPLFGVAGVFLGGWLAGTKNRGPRIYAQTQGAFLMAFFFVSVFAAHWTTFIPASHRSEVHDWFRRFYLAWSLFYLAGVLWWVRPIQRHLDGAAPGLKALARRRAAGFNGFVAALAGAWAAPALLYWALGGSKPWVAALTVGEAYYLAYLGIIFLEPCFFNEVLPALYEGPELYERKRGGTLTVRAKLWLMVASLVIVPMFMVVATLFQQHQSLSAVWPVPAAFVILALCSVIGYCEVLYQSVTRPLAELVKKMERVAGGDFAVRTSVLSGDELGLIKSHFNEMAAGLAERERIRDTFGKYVSVEVAKRLIEEGGIELGGEDIEATILFSDIRNFTSMSEAMSAKALVKFLNEYFAHVTVPIMEHHGIINKFIGDAVMGVFAGQFGSPNHVDDALRAVLGMREKLAEFNAKGLVAGEVRFGIGIHTGTLVAGNVGTEKRLEYTVIGDTVNIASRLESENKAQKSTVLISGDTYERLSPALKEKFSFEKVENIAIRGKRKALTLYKAV